MGLYEEAERLENKVIKVNDGEGNAPEGWGLCSYCSNFQWIRTAYGSEWVECARNDYERGRMIRLKKNDPVSSCSYFYRRGAMSLQDMLQMATLIDVRKTIGFTGNETVEIDIKPPKEKGRDDE